MMGGIAALYSTILWDPIVAPVARNNNLKKIGKKVGTREILKAPSGPHASVRTGRSAIAHLHQLIDAFAA